MEQLQSRGLMDAHGAALAAGGHGHEQEEGSGGGARGGAMVAAAAAAAQGVDGDNFSRQLHQILNADLTAVALAQGSLDNIPLGPLGTLMPLLQMAGVLNDPAIKAALKQVRGFTAAPLSFCTAAGRQPDRPYRSKTNC